MQKFFLVTSLLLPTDSVYKRSLYEVLGGADWAGMALSDLGPFSLPSIPSNIYLLYTVGYAAVLLLLGCRAFSRKDL
ncbi:hypothetical protein D3C81_1694560 [compost metagenome]